MKNEYELIDFHKLAYHPEWVKRWHAAQGNWELAKTIYPLYVEVSPAGQCNHRCPWCAVDYIGYKNRLLNFDRFGLTLNGMMSRRRTGEGWNGVKSIMFAGEGEPTLHPKLADMVVATKENGIDVALTTNGTGMNARFTERALSSITWIKVSLDAASAPVHAINHHATAEQFAIAGQDCYSAVRIGTELSVKFKGEFEKILNNIRYVCEVNARRNFRCMVGAQLLLNPTNVAEVYDFAKLMKNVGCDYCVIKPYSQHFYSLNQQEKILGSGFRYSDLVNLAEKFTDLSDSNYNIVFRSKTMQNYEEENRHYLICQATPMAWGYIMATGDFVSCSAYLPQDIGCGDQRFVLGNINNQGFQEIWEGEKRRKNWGFVNNELDITECRKNCRMDAVNRFLWDEVRGLEPESLDGLFPIIGQTPRNVNFI